MDLVTLKTYTYPYEMAIVRSLLESEGIQTFAMDEVISQVNPFLANAVGGVKLQVAAEDASRAMEIMLEKGFIAPYVKKPPTTEEKLGTLLRNFEFGNAFIPIVLILIVIAFVIYLMFG